MLNWILTLVLLCSAVGSVRSCDWLRIYGDLSNDSMSLLDQMGGSVASWELIRKESKVHLEMLDLLQVTIPRPAKSG
ncbi:hypothetical protein NHX12_031433 [Muraenolepis orangiensis]|uniref:Uncharacterized protein n=1 Tax=Muraenolepis orangiensis TaxID=630683 RepID=A0A9Q0E4H1_9TELE|nr:hypothetical protein NHX12_031433 [Muraenolepis orangiensis]